MEQDSNVVMEGEQDTKDQKASSSKRINGKKLRKIRHQMEFYFSDANLRRDRFMGKLVQESGDGYVDLTVFQTFNRIQSLTENVEDIAKAVSQSYELEIDESSKKVRRKNPYAVKKKNVEELTVYVEHLPPHADIKFVKNIFQGFGKVAFISMPRFRNSNESKGFAFVEFDSPESVKLACENFKTEPVDENAENPEILQEKLDEKKKNKSEQNVVESKDSSGSKSRKRKKSETADKPLEKVPKVEDVGATDKVSDLSKLQKLDSSTVKHAKKRKRQSSESETVPKKTKTEEPSEGSKEPEASESRPQLPTEETREEEMVGTDVVESSLSDKDPCTTAEVPADMDEASKNKRKRKKASDSEKLKLRVLSMVEWKAYRNRYLTMQRKAMSTVKKLLLIDQRQRNECEAMLSHAPWPENQKWKGTKQERRSKKSTNIPHQKGVIVKVAISSEDTVPEQFKEQIKTGVDDVAYVDVSTLSESKLYLRFRSPEGASSATKCEMLTKIGTCEILSGEEESSYWIKLENDRKIQKNRPRTKVRGRDKILAKTTKPRTTRFHNE